MTKRGARSTLAILLLVWFAGGGSAVGERHAGLEGRWTGILKEDPGFGRDVVELRQQGEAVSGTITSVKGLSWNVSGFVRDQFVVLAYRSTSPRRAGVGTLFLIKESDGDSYGGYIVATDCLAKKVVQQPYVLAKGDPKAVEIKYSILFAKEPVNLLDFNCPSNPGK